MLYCTKAAYRILKRNNAYGHIINMNSILGHKIPIYGPIPIGNVYAGTMHCITGTTEVLRQELNFFKNNKVKVSVS